MVALADRKPRRQPTGSPLPRIAPPRPLRHRGGELVAVAAALDIAFMPWQVTAASYIEAQGPKAQWLFPEVAIIVGRQNGKTEVLVPHICRRLLLGRRIMHTAQNRELPREVFGRVADHMMSRHRGELATKPRFANGQEEIRLRNGGRYRIVAPTRGGARGPSNDDLLIDEIRELVDHDFIAAAKPTLSASANPQTIYLSNAGTEESAVLNSLKKRSLEDHSLAYLEWSAAPERDASDVKGWCEANPAIGFLAQKLENVEREYRANSLGGTMEVFETEYLCRWQTTLDAQIVQPAQWAAQEFAPLSRPTRAFMAINMDSSGERASAIVAWQDPDGRINVDVHDTKGSPIDAELLGPDLQKIATDNRAWLTAFDPYTDGDLARHLRKAKPLNGREYALASEKFVRLVAERKFRVNDPDGVIAEDLRWTTRKTGQSGSYMAVRASEEHTNTAATALIRAAWLASAPTNVGRLRMA